MIRPLLALSAVALLAVLAVPSAPVFAQQSAGARPHIGDTVTTASGLEYVFTKQGTGPRPQSGDVMVIHGIGRFTDGKEFWNTRTENAPYEYTPGVDRVIKGFEEGMKEVREGDRIVITMKPELAYGDRARPDIPANSTLVFDYEVLAVHPLSIARLVRDGIAAGSLDAAIARANALPNLKAYYVSESSLLSVANAANRAKAANGETGLQRGDGAKVIELGLTLLPNSDRLRQTLTRFQTQRTALLDSLSRKS